MTISDNLVFADYSGMTVVLGEVTVDTSSEPGKTIFNASDHAIASFDSFSVGLDQIYVINSPSFLAQVTGSSVTEIAGSLQSYGQFILTNPNGIYITQSGNIQGSVILSTLNIQNQLYQADQLVFEKTHNFNSEIINEGTITANGGYIALLSDSIQNKGILIANQGSVVLVAGEKTALSFDGQGLINFVIDKPLPNALDKPAIENTGAITADAGKVVLTAKTLNDTMTTLVNQQGIVRASRAVAKDGKIEFVSNGGILNPGTIDTNLLMEEGYSFKTTGTVSGGSAFYDNIDGAANISGNIGSNQTDTGDLIVTGNITLTANNLTFTADSNNDGNGQFDMNSGTSIAGGGFNLTIKTGHKTSAGVSSNADLGTITGVNRLTLDRAGAASTPTYASDPTSTTWTITDFRIASNTKLNRFTGTGTSTNPSLIYDVYGLQGVKGYLSDHFKLANDINASGTSSWNLGVGFSPIGTDANGQRFSGVLNGNNQIITNLSANQGLFGAIEEAQIQNLTLQNISLSSQAAAGGLAGIAYGGSVSNVHVNGTVNGYSYVGGLIGASDSVTITDSSASVSISSTSPGDDSGYEGGLVGYAVNTTITNSYTNGTVSGKGNFGEVALATGGLVGYFSTGTITNSYSSAAVSISQGTVGGLIGETHDSVVTGSYHDTEDIFSSGDNVLTNTYVGGLIGYAQATTVTSSYASGTVSSDSDNGTGGLVGYYDGGTITNSYYSGDVSGKQSVGGLVGQNASGNVEKSYSSGSAQGTSSNVGGLIGYNGNLGAHTVSNSYSTASATGAIGSNYVGGLIGLDEAGSVINCYATGDIFGGSVGGLVGGAVGTSIENSYSLGTILGAGILAGSLLGYEDGYTISNSYFIDSDNDNGLGALESGGVDAFKSQSHAVYNGSGNSWGFGGTWEFVDSNSFPTLYWQRDHQISLIMPKYDPIVVTREIARNDDIQDAFKENFVDMQAIQQARTMGAILSGAFFEVDPRLDTQWGSWIAGHAAKTFDPLMLEFK